MSEFICGDCMEGMKRFPDGSEKVRTEEDYRRAFSFLSVGIMPTDNMIRAAGIDKETARYMWYKALRRMYDGSK